MPVLRSFAGSGLREAACGLLLVVVLLCLAAPGTASDTAPPGPAEVLVRLTRSYERIERYRTETEVTEFREGHVAETKRFRYSFSRPDRIHIEMIAPHPGTTLDYPAGDGKVAVSPGGWAGFLTFHLATGSSLLRTDAGQRIDQTGMGMLIANIARSLTGKRRGEIAEKMENGLLQLEVLSDDHFLPGIRTRYRFTIDTQRWLPVEVREFTPDGVPRRTVRFLDMQTTPRAPVDGVPLQEKDRSDAQHR